MVNVKVLASATHVNACAMNNVISSLDIRPGSQKLLQIIHASYV